MANLGALVVSLQLESGAFEAGMQRAQASTKRMQQAIQELQRGGLDKVAAGMTFAGSTANKWEMGLRSLAQQQGTATESARRMGLASLASVDGFRRAENAVNDLGLGVVGFQGKAGKLAEFFLNLGVGGAWTLGITAGLAVVGFAWEKLTEKTRKAREEAEKAIAAGAKAARLRFDPAAELRDQLKGVEGQATVLQRRLAESVTLRENRAAAGLPRSMTLDEQIAKWTVDLQNAKRAAGEFRKQIDELETKDSQSALRDLAFRVGTFGMSDLEVERARLAMIPERVKGEHAVAFALLDRLKALEAGKQAENDATDRQKRYASWLEKSRAAAADLMGVLSRHAAEADAGIRKDMLDRIQRTADAKDKFEQSARERLDQSGFVTMLTDMKNAPAKLWEETWKNAVRGAQDSLAQFFMNLGKEGSSVVDLFRGIASEIQNLFAQLAAQSIIRAIFPSFFAKTPAATGHSGAMVGAGGGMTLVSPLAFLGAPRMHSGGMLGLGPDEVPFVGKRGERVLSRAETAAYGRGGGPTVVKVSQAITFNVSALDAASVDALLRSRAATIAGVVAQAASDAPAFARHVVQSGLR